MDAELTALAASGATALVQQMVGDGWRQVRDRLAGLLARGRGADDENGANGADGPDGSDRADAAGAAGRGFRDELDASRQELLAAREAGDEEAEADVRTEWRARMRRALRADPGLASELRALVDEMTERQPAAPGTVYNSISGGVQHGTVIQAGTVGDVHLGAPPPRRPSGT